jgi:hypothetical protein
MLKPLLSLLILFISTNTFGIIRYKHPDFGVEIECSCMGEVGYRVGYHNNGKTFPGGCVGLSSEALVENNVYVDYDSKICNGASVKNDSRYKMMAIYNSFISGEVLIEGGSVNEYVIKDSNIITPPNQTGYSVVISETNLEEVTIAPKNKQQKIQFKNQEPIKKSIIGEEKITYGRSSLSPSYDNLKEALNPISENLLTLYRGEQGLIQAFGPHAHWKDIGPREFHQLVDRFLFTDIQHHDNTKIFKTYNSKLSPVIENNKIKTCEYNLNYEEKHFLKAWDKTKPSIVFNTVDASQQILKISTKFMGNNKINLANVYPDSIYSTVTNGVKVKEDRTPVEMGITAFKIKQKFEGFMELDPTYRQYLEGIAKNFRHMSLDRNHPEYELYNFMANYSYDFVSMHEYLSQITPGYFKELRLTLRSDDRNQLIQVHQNFKKIIHACAELKKQRFIK